MASRAALSRSRPLMGPMRYDVSPHLVKWWKGVKPDDGQVRGTLLKLEPGSSLQLGVLDPMIKFDHRARSIIVQFLLFGFMKNNNRHYVCLESIFSLKSPFKYLLSNSIFFLPLHFQVIRHLSPFEQHPVMPWFKTWPGKVRRSD